MKVKVGDYIDSGPLLAFSGVRASGKVIKVETLEGGTDKYTVYFPFLGDALIIYEEQINGRESS